MGMTTADVLKQMDATQIEKEEAVKTFLNTKRNPPTHGDAQFGKQAIEKVKSESLKNKYFDLIFMVSLDNIL